MAINTGDLLMGLGAAIGGTGPQFVQGLQQREQQITEQKRAELQARQKAMYQDAATGLQLLSMGDLDGLIALGEDRLQLLQTYPDADPSDTQRVVQNARLAKQGDPVALRNLATELSSAASRGIAMGLVELPEAQKPVVVGNSLVSPTGKVLYQQPEKVEERKPIVVNGTVLDPNTYEVLYSEGAKPEKLLPQTSQAKLQFDVNQGLITQEQANAELAREQALAAEQLSAAKAQVSQREEQQAKTQEQSKMAQDELLRAYSIVDNLVTNPDIGGVFGSMQGRMPSFRQGVVDAEIKINELKDLLTMANLGRMSGVLSESDMKLISNAASGIDLRLSDEMGVAKLNEIRDRIKLRLEEKGLLPPTKGQPPTSQKGVTVNWGDLPNG